MDQAQQNKAHRPWFGPLKIGLAVLLALLLVGIGYVVWRKIYPKTSPQTQKQQAATLASVQELSSRGACKEAVIQAQELLDQRGLQASVKATAELTVGQCQLTAKEYDEAAKHLEKAKDQFSKLNDTYRRTQAELLLQQIKVKQATQSPKTPATPPAANTQKNGTYDGVHSL